MGLENTSAFDFDNASTPDPKATATFDCPSCDATAPSTAVPYGALGYAACPACGHSTQPGRDE